MLGLVVGALEYYVYLFIVLYLLNMPIFGLTYVSESELGTFMLENTPILSELVDDTVKVYSDVWDVIKNRGSLTNKEVNTFVLATLLDNNLISIESARELVESNYIIIKDNSILDRYSDNGSFFEEIGGCLLLGGCDGDSSNIHEIYSTTIKNPGDSATYQDISFKVNYISANRCVEEGNCSSDEKLEVGLLVDVGFGEREMKLKADGKYRWIMDTTKYIFVKVQNGNLVVGIAEYK